MYNNYNINNDLLYKAVMLMYYSNVGYRFSRAAYVS